MKVVSIVLLDFFKVEQLFTLTEHTPMLKYSSCSDNLGVQITGVWINKDSLYLIYGRIDGLHTQQPTHTQPLTLVIPIFIWLHAIIT